MAKSMTKKYEVLETGFWCWYRR